MKFNLGTLGKFQRNVQKALPVVKSAVAVASVLNSTYKYKNQENVQSVLERLASAVVVLDTLASSSQLGGRT